MDRREKILAHVSKSGRGLEVGPSHNPIAPKKEGFNVDIIDYLDREGLVKKFEGNDVAFDNIEEVDFVWKGEPYAQLTGRQHYYDWVIASHVVEHTPDLVGFLNECDSIVKETGVVSLAVPDKRFCFDHFRPITGLSKIIDSHLANRTQHTPGTAVEFHLNTVKKDSIIAWGETHKGDYSFFNAKEGAREIMDRMIKGGEYLDFHSWCFTPHSFRLIIQDLYELGLTPLKEVDFFPTTGHEFYITLGRQGRGLDMNRLQALELVEDELSVDRVQAAESRKLEVRGKSEQELALEQKLESARGELSNLRDSCSWKWTAPLRWLRDKF